MESVSNHNTTMNFTKNNNQKYSSLCCLELTCYEMHMLHFIDMLWKKFFGLLGFHSWLINWQRKDGRIMEHLYQQFVLLKMFTICIKWNNVLI